MGYGPFGMPGIRGREARRSEVAARAGRTPVMRTEGAGPLCTAPERPSGRRSAVRPGDEPALSLGAPVRTGVAGLPRRSMGPQEHPVGRRVGRRHGPVVPGCSAAVRRVRPGDETALSLGAASGRVSRGRGGRAVVWGVGTARWAGHRGVGRPYGPVARCPCGRGPASLGGAAGPSGAAPVRRPGALGAVASAKPVRAGNEPSLLLGVLPDTREALALDHAEC